VQEKENGEEGGKNIAIAADGKKKGKNKKNWLSNRKRKGLCMATLRGKLTGRGGPLKHDLHHQRKANLGNWDRKRRTNSWEKTNSQRAEGKPSPHRKRRKLSIRPQRGG